MDVRGQQGQGQGDDRSWLQLLLTNAESNDLEVLRQGELERSIDEAGRSWVELEARRAEQLRAQLSDHRRQVSELAALYDLALRLSSVHDLGALLQDTVTQASRLLDVDVAYLALTEDDGSMTIRVTEGSMGQRLRGVSLPHHIGLAGRVAQTGEPVQSMDYLGDPEFDHRDHIDQVAGAEGLRTILGVPLRLRGDIIGALMVAQREVRSFTPGEVSLLGSFAAFAAVAIDNTRLFEDARRVADDLSAANAELREHIESVNRAAVLHDHLLQTALRGNGTEEVLVSVSEVIKGRVLFLDADDRLIGAASDGEVLSDDPGVIDSGLLPSAMFRDPALRRTRVVDDTVSVPVASADSYFGSLLVVGGNEVSEWDIRMLERSAMTMALVGSVERAVGDAERRTTTELLEQLITRRVDDEVHFARRARTLGLDLSIPHVVVVIDPPTTKDEQVLARLTEFVSTHGGVAARVLGHLVGLVRGGEDVVRQFAASAPSPGTIGLSAPASGVLPLAAAYDDARACLTVLHGLDRSGAWASPADLGPFRFLLSRAARADAQRYVQATIGPLLDHDRERNTELVKTANAFLGSGRQHAATAKLLHVHTNTLYQRLDRISAQLGEDWRVGDRALDVQMALRIHHLTERLTDLAPLP